MDKDRIVVVAGATGLIGTAVMAVLRASGWTPVVSSRDPGRAQARYPWAGGFVSDRGPDLEAALLRHGRAIRLAGENPLMQRWNAAHKARMWASRVGQTELFAQTLARSEATGRVLISAGAINIHASAGDAAVTEASPRGDTWVARMLTAKEAALEAAEAAGVRTSTLRIGLALGQGGGPLPFIMQNFAKGMGGHPGNGRQFVPWLHVADMARMFVHALETPGWSGPVIAAAPGPVTARELSRAVGARMGRASWMHPPAFMARLVLGEVAVLVLSSYRAVPARAEALGFRFDYPELDGAFDDLFAAPARERALAGSAA